MKYQEVFTQFLLLLCVVSAQLPTPPQTGKYFYMNFTSPHVADYTTKEPDLIQTGQHFMPSLVSNANQKMNLGLSTQMAEIVLFEKGYDTCVVPNPYDKSQSKTVNDTSVDNISRDVLIEKGTYRVENMTVMGNSLSDQFKFQVEKYQREVTLNLTFFEVYQCTPQTTTAYDGLIGIQQYQADNAAFSSWKYNFMWQLKNPVEGSGFETMIDYMIVQVWAKRGTPGIIKVGGWDQSALKTGEMLKMMKTFDMNSWAIMANSITYDGYTIASTQAHDNVPAGPMKYIEFAPDLPYLYMALPDYTQLGYQLQSFVYNTDTGYKLNCDYDVDGQGYSYCRFKQSCDGIPEKIMKFNLQDSAGNIMTMETKSTDFFVDGENFGHDKDQMCYIPAFRYGLAEPTDTQLNTWFAGSLVWDQYTIVFDNTQYDSNQQSYSMIGLGLKNQEDSGISSFYEKEQVANPAEGEDWIPMSTKDVSHHIGQFDTETIIPMVVPAQHIPKPPVPPAPPSFLEKYWYYVAAASVAAFICMWCTYRCCTYKSPKTYYNAMYSIAQDNPLKMIIQ